MSDAAQQIAGVDPINSWAQFGLAGLVIFALFSVLVIIVKWLVAHIDKQAEEHRKERTEWSDKDDKKSTEFRQTIDTTVDKFTNTIRDLSGRNRQ
jgi:hypothetical protein